MPKHNANYTYQESDMREALEASGQVSNIQIAEEGAAIPRHQGFDGFYHHPLRMADLLNTDIFMADLLTYVQAQQQEATSARIAYPLNLNDQFHWVTFYLEFSEIDQETLRQLLIILQNDDNANVHKQFDGLYKNEMAQNCLKRLFKNVRAVFYNSTTHNYLQDADHQQLQIILSSLFDRPVQIDVPAAPIVQTDDHSCGPITVEQTKALLTRGLPISVPRNEAAAQINTWRAQQFAAGSREFQARQVVPVSRSSLASDSPLRSRSSSKASLYTPNDDEAFVNRMVDKILDALDGNNHFTDAQKEQMRMVLLQYGEEAYKNLASLTDKKAQQAEYQKLANAAVAELQKGNVPAWLQSKLDTAANTCREEASDDFLKVSDQVLPLVK